MEQLGFVQKIGSRLWIVAAGFGYAAHGLSGAATAGVASFFTTSSLAVLMADAGAGVEIGTRVGSTQRFIGALALLACLSGAFLGGWTWGWAGAVGGYLMGIAAGMVYAKLSGAFEETSTTS